MRHSRWRRALFFDFQISHVDGRDRFPVGIFFVRRIPRNDGTSWAHLDKARIGCVAVAGQLSEFGEETLFSLGPGVEPIERSLGAAFANQRRAGFAATGNITIAPISRAAGHQCNGLSRAAPIFCMAALT